MCCIRAALAAAWGRIRLSSLFQTTRGSAARCLSSFRSAPTRTPSAIRLSCRSPRAAANGFVSVADIKLQHFSDGGGKFEDDGRAQFININSFTPGSLPFAPSWVDSQPSGTCLVYNNLNENQNVPFLNFLALDAGAAATVKGPNGSVNLPSNGKDATFDASGSFLTPGSYTMTTPGGADVGPVSFNFTIPALPTLTSPVNNAAVTRSAGLPVTWTGGSGTLIIEIAAPVDTTGNNGYVGVCFVDAAAKSFTVPPYILLALPPTP